MKIKINNTLGKMIIGPDLPPADFVQAMTARDDIIGALRVPDGWQIKDIQGSRWHSVYWLIEDPDGKQYKLRIADHASKPNTHGGNDFEAELPKQYTLDMFLEKISRAENWLRKMAGENTTAPENESGGGVGIEAKPKELNRDTDTRPQSSLLVKMWVRCLTDGEITNGGPIKTRAKTDAGILAAAKRQIWAGSPAAFCGYKLLAVRINPETAGGRLIPNVK